MLVDGAIRTMPIVGINHEFNNLGQMATTLTASLYPPNAPSFSQPLYLARLEPGANPGAIASRVRAASAPTVVLAVFACVVAVPLAGLGGKSLLETLQGGIGIGPLSMPVPATVLAVIPAVIAIAILGALGPAWLASRASVTSVVREL